MTAKIIRLLPYVISTYVHLDKPTLLKVTYQHHKCSRVTCLYRVRSLIHGNLYILSGEVWSPILNLLNNKSADILKFVKK